MRKLATTFLLACLCAGIVYAQAAKTATTTKTTTAAPSSATADALKQLEHDWTDAMKAKNADKVAAILADDWVGVGPDGKSENKQQFISDIKTGKDTITSFDFGPMDVKVIGTVGIVQGTNTQKATMDGKDASGKYQWMDVFAKRGDKWVAVRSTLAMVM
jgi:ketosteroid isomerase-like protein